jgi:hypothetical protein
MFSNCWAAYTLTSQRTHSTPMSSLVAAVTTARKPQQEQQLPSPALLEPDCSSLHPDRMCLQLPAAAPFVKAARRACCCCCCWAQYTLSTHTAYHVFPGRRLNIIPQAAAAAANLSPLPVPLLLLGCSSSQDVCVCCCPLLLEAIRGRCCCCCCY